MPYDYTRAAVRRFVADARYHYEDEVLQPLLTADPAPSLISGSVTGAGTCVGSTVPGTVVLEEGAVMMGCMVETGAEVHLGKGATLIQSHIGGKLEMGDGSFGCGIHTSLRCGADLVLGAGSTALNVWYSKEDVPSGNQTKCVFGARACIVDTVLMSAGKVQVGNDAVICNVNLTVFGMRSPAVFGDWLLIAPVWVRYSLEHMYSRWCNGGSVREGAKVVDVLLRAHRVSCGDNLRILCGAVLVADTIELADNVTWYTPMTSIGQWAGLGTERLRMKTGSCALVTGTDCVSRTSTSIAPTFAKDTMLTCDRHAMVIQAHRSTSMTIQGRQLRVPEGKWYGI